MGDELLKKLEAVHLKFEDLLKTKDYGKVAELYTEGGTLMLNGVDPVVGRKSLAEFFKSAFPAYEQIVFEKNVFFEQVNDSTALTTDFFAARLKKGNEKELMQATILWKKVDGQWFYDRDLTSNRPLPPTPESVAKKQIEAREKELYDAFNSDDYDKALTIYTPDATVIPHEGEIVTGKEAIKAIFKEVIPLMKTLVIEETYHFELLNDTKAYTNSHMRAVDPDGNIKAVFRDCLIWKKIDGEWFIFRDMFNDRPMPSK